MEWQPIESAPRNGAPILLALSRKIESNDILNYAPWDAVSVVIGWWSYDMWECCFTEEGAADTEGNAPTFFMPIYNLPTHWMPLPEPPE